MSNLLNEKAIWENAAKVKASEHDALIRDMDSRTAENQEFLAELRDRDAKVAELEVMNRGLIQSNNECGDLIRQGMKENESLTQSLTCHIDKFKLMEQQSRDKDTKIAHLESSLKKACDDLSNTERAVSTLEDEKENLQCKLNDYVQEMEGLQLVIDSLSAHKVVRHISLDSSQNSEDLEEVRRQSTEEINELRHRLRVIEESSKSRQESKSSQESMNGPLFITESEPMSRALIHKDGDDNLAQFEDFKINMAEGLIKLKQDILAKDGEIADLLESKDGLSYEINRLQRSLQLLAEENTTRHETSQIHSGEVAKLREELYEIKQQMIEKDAIIESMEQIQAGMSKKATELQQSILSEKATTSQLKEDLKSHKMDLVRLHAVLENRNKDLESIGLIKESLEENLKKYQEECTLKDRSIAQVEESAKNEALQARNELQDKINTLEEQIQCIKNHLESRTRDLVSTRHQLIQQDETIEQIREEITKKDNTIKELHEIKDTSAYNLCEYQEQIKSVTSENKRLKDDIQNLQNELTQFRQDLQEKINTIESLDGIKEKMDEALEWAMTERKLRESVERKHNDIDRLNKKKLETLEAENQSMNATVDKLRKDNTDKSSKFSQLEKELQSLKEVQTKNGMLQIEVEQLNRQISELKDSSYHSSDSETVQAYERQMSALTMNNNVTIDTLRKDLASARARSAEEVARLTNELSKMQEENEELKKQCNADAIRMRDQHIYALEHTLVAQEKTVDSLRAELHHLQNSMTDAAEQRRNDLQDLQEEILDSQSKLLQQDRECAALKVQLDDCKARYDSDVEKLQKEIDKLKKSPSAERSFEFHQENLMLEVKKRLEQLKETNIELKEQNVKLAARLEKASMKVKAIEAEKDIATEMEEECADLRRQVKELEQQLEVASGSAGTSSKSPTTSDASFNSENKMKKESRSSVGKKAGNKLNFGGKSKIPSVLFIGKLRGTSNESTTEKLVSAKK
jgi:chromosome segregation ATPase